MTRDVSTVSRVKIREASKGFKGEEWKKGEEGEDLEDEGWQG